MKIKIICPCGCEVRKSDLKRHRSNKHNQLLKEQEENIIN